MVSGRAGLAVAALLACGGAADLESALERTVTSFMETHGIPGCSVAVGDGRTVRVAEGYGHSGPDRAADARTIYPVGSLSKQFTAALVLLAASRSIDGAARLDLEAGVSDIFPELGLPGGLSIRHLLGHVSGLGSYTDGGLFRHGQFAPIAADTLLARIAGLDRLFAPGSEGHYNNSNYLLLARLLERHFGRPFDALLRRHLLDPLGLEDTGSIGGGTATADATGSTETGFTEERTDPSWVTGAGGLRSTVADLARWTGALLGGDVLDPEALAVMFAPGLANRQPAVEGERLAAGWMDISTPKGRRLYHQGFIHGFSAVSMIEPDSSRYAIILCNRALVGGLPALATDLLDLAVRP